MVEQMMMMMKKMKMKEAKQQSDEKRVKTKEKSFTFSFSWLWIYGAQFSDKSWFLLGEQLHGHACVYTIQTHAVRVMCMSKMSIPSSRLSWSHSDWKWPVRRAFDDHWSSFEYCYEYASIAIFPRQIVVDHFDRQFIEWVVRLNTISIMLCVYSFIFMGFSLQISGLFIWNSQFRL